MLPEITHDVLRYLSRDDLNTAEISTKAFNAFISTHLDVNPLRTIWRFTVYQDETMSLQTGKWLPIETNEDLEGITADDLEHELRRTFIRATYFYCVVTDAIVDTLLPHVNRCRNAICHAANRYASSEVITRAFTELFFCREIHVDTLSVKDVDDYWAYNNEAAFAALPCIQSCDLLSVHHLHRTKTDFTTKLQAWLHSGGEKKKLTLECSMPLMSLSSRSRVLFNNIENATSPAAYELTFFVTNNLIIGTEKAVNEKTNEELVRSNKRCKVGYKVTFVRRPL